MSARAYLHRQARGVAVCRAGIRRRRMPAADQNAQPAAGMLRIPALQDAFTLVEVMIVIAIMVALMAIVVPGYQAMSAQGERNSCAANLKAIGQALALFREDYQCFPPDATEFLPLPEDPDELNGNPQPADLIHAANDPETGIPIDTGMHGLGLYTLYYLGVYSATLPPFGLEPEARLGSDLRRILTSQKKGLNGLLWFRGGGYIINLDLFHCPANRVKLNEGDLVNRDRLPYLGGWNNYDQYYHRDFWNPGWLPDATIDRRNLCQPYPPADTVVTWCPHHRTSNPPRGPGIAGAVNSGDKDLVLFADGSVHRMTSRADNRMFAEPPNDTGWPAGPVM